MINTFFNPDPLVGSYSTNYEYDLAGNIIKLNRNGLVQIDGGIPEFGRIDSLWYTYNNERLQSVSDLLDSTTLAQPKGFGPVFSGYDYDGNGNLTGDDGKGLAIHYNLLNLPDSITDQTDNIWLDYTFGGQKIRKELSGGEDRFYLGGLEVVDGDFEAFYHPEGRAVWRNDTLRFQYKLTDHLGNTVVLFEDKNLDTQILTEEMTEDTLLLEVLQRNYYYPFGLEMEGLWDSQTGPGMRYLYNGKEFNEDLGLKWYAYGFRYYDPSIGRFTGVDPLADLAPAWVPYRYGFDNPILYTDPFGLFETRAEAKEHRKKEKINGRVRKQDDGSFAIVHKDSDRNIKTFNDGEFGVMTEYTYAERGVHLRDIGLDGFNDLSDPYSESYNPNAVIQIDWADRSYYFGSLLGIASPSARVTTASKVATEGAVQYSDDLIRAAQQAYPKLAGKIQNHHITPKFLGGAKNGPTVPLDAAYHQQITNAFRQAWSYGKGPITDPVLRRQIMDQVYKQFPLPQGYTY